MTFLSWRRYFIIIVLLLNSTGLVRVQGFHVPRNLAKHINIIFKLAATSRNEILEYLFFGDVSKKHSFTDLDYVGYGDVDSSNGIRQRCLFLCNESMITVVGNRDRNTSAQHTFEAMPVPLSDSISEECLRLIVRDQRNEPSSMAVVVPSTTCIVNRDNALFDNLPWAEWTIDPQSTYKDSTGRVVDSKYHMGKRIAYNRLMGGEHKEYGNDSVSQTGNNIQYQPTSLEEKVLQLEIKEARMKVAEADENLAIARAVKSNNLDLDTMAMFDADMEMASQTLREAQFHLSRLERTLESRSTWTQYVSLGTQFIHQLLSGFQLWSRKADQTSESRLGESSSSFHSSCPYSLLQHIIREQLNAEIIACVLENTLFQGNVQLGGAIVISRRGRSKSIRVDGKVITFEDSDDDFGNKGIKRGDIRIVDCDVDEAIGMAKSCGLSLLVETSTWEDLKVRVSLITTDNSSTAKVQVIDPNFKLYSSEMTEASSNIAASSSSVDSLEAYDLLTNEDKARLLMAYSVKVPRSRMLRNISLESKGRNLLDDLLLPLLDESVRRSFLIRMASNRGDIEEVERLRREMSERQKMKELSIQACREGDDKKAEALNDAAIQQGNLRADTTQDEGAYSRDLDRDLWYEINRQRITKKH